MMITGQQLINGQWVQGEAGQYQAVNPAAAAFIEPVMSYASKAQVHQAVAAAAAAAPVFAATSLKQRAEFLELCADEIMALGDVLPERVALETGYPKARGEGERARTVNQLRLFASSIRSGEYLNIRIDTALPERQPLPRPDLRYTNQPIGPVVVFGASNFPLAFSVAGGDTAAALAAGCPVIVKGHNSHPGTCELVARALHKAVQKAGLPAGVFSLIMGSGREVGSELVVAPEVKAVGFTGSLAGGMALFQLANNRPEPIPVFAEMGSVNPVVFLPQALQQSGAALAQGYVASLTLGCGQFCVNPGVAVAIAGPELDSFMQSAAEALAQQFHQFGGFGHAAFFHQALQFIEHLLKLVARHLHAFHILGKLAVGAEWIVQAIDAHRDHSCDGLPQIGEAGADWAGPLLAGSCQLLQELYQLKKHSKQLKNKDFKSKT